MPVIPATWVAETEELLEPGRQRFRWAEIGPLHFSSGDRVRLHLKNKKQRRIKIRIEKEGENLHLVNLFVMKEGRRIRSPMSAVTVYNTG